MSWKDKSNVIRTRMHQYTLGWCNMLYQSALYFRNSKCIYFRNIKYIILICLIFLENKIQYYSLSCILKSLNVLFYYTEFVRIHFIFGISYQKFCRVLVDATEVRISPHTTLNKAYANLVKILVYFKTASTLFQSALYFKSKKKCKYVYVNVM